MSDLFKGFNSARVMEGFKSGPAIAYNAPLAPSVSVTVTLKGENLSSATASAFGFGSYAGFNEVGAVSKRGVGFAPSASTGFAFGTTFIGPVFSDEGVSLLAKGTVGFQVPTAKGNIRSVAYSAEYSSIPISLNGIIGISTPEYDAFKESYKTSPYLDKLDFPTDKWTPGYTRLNPDYDYAAIPGVHGFDTPVEHVHLTDRPTVVNNLNAGGLGATPIAINGYGSAGTVAEARAIDRQSMAGYSADSIRVSYTAIRTWGWDSPSEHATRYGSSDSRSSLGSRPYRHSGFTGGLMSAS